MKWGGFGNFKIKNKSLSWSRFTNLTRAATSTINRHIKWWNIDLENRSPVLGVHLLSSEFLAKLLRLKTSGRVNIISLNFLAYAVFKLVLEENSCMKKLRSFIGTDMKWTSTYIKRINYTKIYAQTHYHQCTEMFPKLTKWRITLLRQWEGKHHGDQTSQTILMSHEQAEPLTFHARGLSPCGPGHLPREAGALHCLGSFLNPVLVAAPVHGHNFTRPLLHLVLA